LYPQGSGTGIFTRLFLSSLPSEIKLNSFKAVEPAQGMRKGFEEKVLSILNEDIKSKVTLLDGEFSRIPETGDGQVDLVVVAQAFHWSGKDGTPALVRPMPHFRTRNEIEQI
jgi:hypothetical protein